MILETTVQASEKEWDVRKKKIADDTKKSIEKSANDLRIALASKRKELAELQNIIETTEQQHSNTNNRYVADIRRFNSETNELKVNNSELAEKNARLLNENNLLIDGIEDKKTSISNLTLTEHELISSISLLLTKETSLTESISQTETSLTQKQEELTTLTDDINKNREAMDAEIAIHIYKKQSIKREIIEMQTNDEKIRSDLATWQRKLAEQDKNLRIRELKTTQQEESISRNYDLLNM